MSLSRRLNDMRKTKNNKIKEVRINIIDVSFQFAKVETKQKLINTEKVENRKEKENWRYEKFYN